MPARNTTQLSLLHKVPTGLQVIAYIKQKTKYPAIQWKVQEISALFFKQTPALQKLESRWECYTKQDYSASQVTYKIACNTFFEHLLIHFQQPMLMINCGKRGFIYSREAMVKKKIIIIIS